MNRLLFSTMVFCQIGIALGYPGGIVLDAPRSNENYVIKADFFQNSVRRGPNEAEKNVMVRMETSTGGSCSAFFIRNSGNKAFVGTARHCARYNLTDACAQKRLKFTLALNSAQATCKRIVAASVKHDFAILEIDVPNWHSLTAQIQFLKLSSVLPSKPVWLKMIGYPGDLNRNGALTVTENCWNKGSANLVSQNLTAAEQLANSQWRSQHPQSAEETAAREKLTDAEYALFHNCTVYGGNSGGPILVAGTGTVIGLPTSYVPRVTRTFPETYGAYMSSMVRFVTDLSSVLASEGIAPVNPI